MRYDTLPSPCPSTADVKTIQAAADDARQAHSRATATESVPEPPVELNDDAGAETVDSHRDEAGVVTLVEVEPELPQPYATISANAAANS